MINSENDNYLLKINLILPENLIIFPLPKNKHVYFLAGPIRGAGDWQKDAIKMLAHKDRGCYVICPSRYKEQHELYSFYLGLLNDQGAYISSNPSCHLSSQTLWERYYLELASYYGSIIFWLPQESKADPRKAEDGPYARETMGEIGRWSIRSAYGLGLRIGNKIKKRINLVIGAEKEFSGLKTIQTNLNADHNKEYYIYPSLEETIDKAIELSKNC